MQPPLKYLRPQLRPMQGMQRPLGRPLAKHWRAPLSNHLNFILFALICIRKRTQLSQDMCEAALINAKLWTKVSSTIFNCILQMQNIMDFTHFFNICWPHSDKWDSHVPIRPQLNLHLLLLKVSTCTHCQIITYSYKIPIMIMSNCDSGSLQNSITYNYVYSYIRGRPFDILEGGGTFFWKKWFWFSLKK